MKKNKNITRLDPYYFLQPIDNIISKSHSQTLMGLRTIEALTSLPNPTFEETQTLQFMGLISDFETSKQEYKNWLLIKGFEEINSAIRNSLEKFLVYIKAHKELKSSGIQEKDLCSYEKSTLIAIKKMHYPTLVKKIGDELGEELKHGKNIDSFNNARNCLIHDYGKVVEGRCNNSTKTELHIIGNRFIFFFQVEGSEERQPMELGKPGPPNASLKMMAEEFTLAFKLGDTINIDYLNYLHILSTCIFYKADLEVKIGKYCT